MSAFLPGFSDFSVGCNYWASHAGISMWHEWDLDEVEKDFIAMKNAGMNTVRIFPLWSDFQPVQFACRCNGEQYELTFTDGRPLPAKGLEHYGLSEIMIQRFRQVADLAEKYDIKLIVALLTGWMSGALFIPPALNGKNLFTDPDALKLETLFIRGFVNALKDHNAIAAWEPGNECNCLSESPSVTVSWNWLNMIASTVKLADPARPIYTGMHGASIDPLKRWNCMMQGELYDALTTHPYPAFTPHCGQSALNTIPAIYHATAETLYYAGGSGKPAFVEEIGAFGPGYLCEERTESYLYNVLYSAWAHGLNSVLWWCGFSFDRCPQQYPYRWNAMERELGAIKSDRTPSGAAKAMKKFRADLAALDFKELPPRKIDAVVIMTEEGDSWKTVYSSFMMSKGAGFEVEYCNIAAVDELPDSKFYIVPAITGYNVMNYHKYQMLLKKAEEGATVFVTASTGMLQPFVPVFGCAVDYCTEIPETVEFRADGIERDYKITRACGRVLKALDCDVLAKDTAGNPQMIRRNYGKGQLIYLNVAPETAELSFDNGYYLLYRKAAVLAGIACPEKAPEIGVTTHCFDDGRTLKIRINYADYPVEDLDANAVKLEFV
ncbi:MAG: hypothetical protein IKB16_02390 [Lentisphaeria bacterium]|nr:hypothetical protein [Lentisphaeria bacterium]